MHGRETLLRENHGERPERLVAALSGTREEMRRRVGPKRRMLRTEGTCRWHEKMKKGFFIPLLLTAILALDAPASVGGKLYKWVDDKGVVHFSDRRPEGSEKVLGVLEERDLEEPAARAAPPTRPEKAPAARSPIEHAVHCTFIIKSRGKMGTGFLVSANGMAATCKHVVEGIVGPTAVLNDQSEFPLQVVAVSNKYDLALVQVLGHGDLPFLALRSDEGMVPGERLFAIGTSAGLQSTVTDGVFTGFRKILPREERFIQFSAPVNQGNSGGPLLDAQGRVIGVVSMKTISAGGAPLSGLGFAVPSSDFSEEFRYLIQ
jgi:S1-C subfamily serine protease